MAEWWKDEELVKQVYEEAEKGNTEAQCEIARQLCREQRMEEAISWYQKAAEAGETDAMFNLAMLYSQGFEGMEASKEQAFYWYERAAEAGDAEAMCWTASYLLKGLGTKCDLERAADWLKKALAAGYPAAQELLFTIPGMQEERQQKIAELEKLAQEADSYLEQANYEQAIPFLQKAVENSQERLGESDAFTIGLLNNLAVALASAERFEQSIPLKERVLELRGKSLPVTHPDYLTAVTNLTSDYAHVGRYQSAIHLSKQAYAAARETLPVFHEITLLTLNRLAADYSNLCRHDLALEQLKAVTEQIQSLSQETENLWNETSKMQWERTCRLLEICEQALQEDRIFFGMEESRRSYAYICAELCEMLDGLPEAYRQKIEPKEYQHFQEQANLISSYHPHLNSGQAVETDPYTNALQTLVSLKYLMPSVAECREELDGICCRAAVTWIQNELCMIVTVYPAKSIMEHMEHPQPVDFVKPLNTCLEPGERVLALQSVDLRMKRLENGTIQICFAYGTEDSVYRMIRMSYLEATNQLDGEAAFQTM